MLVFILFLSYKKVKECEMIKKMPLRKKQISWKKKIISKLYKRLRIFEIIEEKKIM